MSEAMQTAPTRPILRYHGGKWVLARWIISRMPAHRIYVEPFGGAGSVLLRKPRSYSEVYNDLDGEVVNLFRVVRERGGELIRLLRRTPYARAEYYASFEPTEDPMESARRLVVRSYMGFGSDSIKRNRRSGFRANANRNGTTPSHDWDNYPGALLRIIKRLKGVTIENRDAREMMAQQDAEGVLHYCDPPYVWAARGQAGHMLKRYNHEMDEAAHVELAGFLRGLRGMVMVSGYDCPLYDKLYGDWRSERREAMADGARPRVEVLWFSPNCPAPGAGQRTIFDGPPDSLNYEP